MSQEILVGPERRRRWSDGEKIAILIEAADPEMTVAEVARRHGITRQHIDQPTLTHIRSPLVDML
ncbi:MAG: transposase, partial [Pseudomonadota bacterium]